MLWLPDGPCDSHSIWPWVFPRQLRGFHQIGAVTDQNRSELQISGGGLFGQRDTRCATHGQRRVDRSAGYIAARSKVVCIEQTRGLPNCKIADCPSCGDNQ
jgi:hypothetical protein